MSAAVVGAADVKAMVWLALLTVTLAVLVAVVMKLGSLASPLNVAVTVAVPPARTVPDVGLQLPADEVRVMVQIGVAPCVTVTVSPSGMAWPEVTVELNTRLVSAP